MDIFPTLCSVANVRIPERHISDGFKLQDQLSGHKSNKREETFLNHFPHEHRSSYFTSLVKSDWKIIYHFQTEGKPHYELYNLKTDPFESDNLADKNPKQLKIMMASLKREMKAKQALHPELEGQPFKIITP